MRAPFVREAAGLGVNLSRRERAVLAEIPRLLASVTAHDPAAARLNPPASLEDPEVADRFRELIADDLELARNADRERFAATLSSDGLSNEDAGAWMRVIGEARLVLGSRLGIDDDGWEMDRATAGSAEGALLHYLGYLQDALATILAEDL